MPVYLDSSALVKRYLTEPGSDRLHRLFDGRAALITSVIAWAECLAAIGRKLHDGTLSTRSHARVTAAFANEWNSLHVLELTREILDSVRELLAQAPLRGMDAIHVASALRAERRLGEPVVFLSFDRKLSTIATELGLGTGLPWD